MNQNKLFDFARKIRYEMNVLEKNDKEIANIILAWIEEKLPNIEDVAIILGDFFRCGHHAVQYCNCKEKTKKAAQAIIKLYGGGV
jgi:hypothetical protein